MPILTSKRHWKCTKDIKNRSLLQIWHRTRKHDHLKWNQKHIIIDKTEINNYTKIHNGQTSRAKAMIASLLFDRVPALGSDWMAMFRLHSGAISNHSGSRMPSKQSLATGYIAPLPSRSISGAVCCKHNTNDDINITWYRSTKKAYNAVHYPIWWVEHVHLWVMTFTYKNYVKFRVFQFLCMIRITTRS